MIVDIIPKRKPSKVLNCFIDGSGTADGVVFEQERDQIFVHELIGYAIVPMDKYHIVNKATLADMSPDNLSGKSP